MVAVGGQNTEQTTLQNGPPFPNRRKRLKLVAVLLISLFFLQTAAMFYNSARNTAFASTDIYSITNNVRFTATPENLSRGPMEITIAVTQCVKGKALLEPTIKPGALATKTDDAGPFQPNLTYQLAGITSIRDFESAKTYQAGPWTINVTGAGRLQGSDYTNRTLAVNMSDYYTHFSHVEVAYPSKGLALFFNSPYNYAAEWCATHGYTLDAVQESNYTQHYNVAALNAYDSELLEEAQIVTQPLPQYPYSLIRGPNQGTKQWEIAAIFAVIMVAFFIWGLPQIVKMFESKFYSDSFQIDSGNRATTTIKAIDTINSTILNLIGGLNSNIALVLSALGNGTISVEQAQALIRMLSGQYSRLINNCTRSIEYIMAAYYNSSAYMFGQYTNGMIALTAWSDAFTQILTFAIVLFVLYAIYAVLLRKKNAGSGAGIVNVFPK
jgi:hypothetical protein